MASRAIWRARRGDARTRSAASAGDRQRKPSGCRRTWLVRQRDMAGHRRTEEGLNRTQAAVPQSRHRCRRNRGPRGAAPAIDGRLSRRQHLREPPFILDRATRGSRLERGRQLVPQRIRQAAGEPHSRGADARWPRHRRPGPCLEPYVTASIRVLRTVMSSACRRLALALLLLAPWASAISLRAESAADHVNALLDGSALNDIWLHINARDWEDLHTHYRE